MSSIITPNPLPTKTQVMTVQSIIFVCGFLDLRDILLTVAA